MVATKGTYFCSSGSDKNTKDNETQNLASDDDDDLPIRKLVAKRNMENNKI